MKTLHQLAKKYRKQIDHKSKIQEQITSLREQERVLQDQVYTITKDMEFTKTLIDYCVLTGESPTEALLKNTREQIRNTLDHASGWVSINTNTLGSLTVSNNSVTGVTITGANITSHGNIMTNTSLAPSTTLTPGAKRVPGSQLLPGV